MRRPQIFLADLLRGIQALNIRDPEVARMALSMLSLEHLEAQPEAVRQSGAAAVWPPRRDEKPPLHIDVAAPTPPPPAPVLTEVRDVKMNPITTAPTSPMPPLWQATTTPLARPSGATPPSGPLEPLFPRSQTRGLLTAALATWDSDGPPDIPRAIEKLAQLRPLRELPRERAATLRLGAQLLIDAGLGMAPFLPDVDQLRGEIAHVLATDRTATFHFAGTPRRRCVADGHGEIKPWPVPPRGTPILVITDLGIGKSGASEERAAAAEWLEFFEAVAVAACPVTALVPYGPQRWPRELAHAVRIIHWDRRTSAAAVRRTLVDAWRTHR
jgi:hypothetical protein